MCDEITRPSDGMVTGGAADAPRLSDNSIVIDAGAYDSNAAQKANTFHDDSDSYSKKNKKEINDITKLNILDKEERKQKMQVTSQITPQLTNAKLNNLITTKEELVEVEESLYTNEEADAKEIAAESGMMLLYIPTSFVNAAGQTVCIRRRCLVHPESEYGQFMLGSSELLNTHYANVAMMTAEEVRDRVRHEQDDIKESVSEEENAAASETVNTDSVVINTEALAYCEERRTNSNMCNNISNNAINDYSNEDGNKTYTKYTNHQRNEMTQDNKSTTFTYMRYLPCWRRKRPRWSNDLDQNNYSNNNNSNNAGNDQENYSECARSTSCPERASTVKRL